MKRALVAWVLLLLAAWCLWLWQLDASDLTFDEAATYFVAHRPVLEIVPYLRSAIREHPPLYYLLIRAWMVVAGTGEFSLRLFSVGMGMVALVLTGWAARTTRTELGAGRGVLPALFLAAMPGVAYYVRDARMYSMCIAWAALSCGLFLRDWVSGDGWPRRSAIVLLTGVHFLSLFTHYYLLLPMLIQPLLLLLLRRWRPLALWCAAHGLPAVAGLAWLLLAPGLQATTQGIWSDFFSLTLPTRFQFLRLLGKLVFSPVLQVPYKLLYQVLALAGAGLLLALWRRRVVGVWLALAAAIPLMLAYQLPQPPVERYVLFLTLPLALAWGALATAPLRLPWRWVGRVTVLLLALGTAYPLARGGLLDAVSYVRSRYGEVVETVAAYARPGDGVLFYGPWQHIQFIYYEPGDFPPVTMLPRYAPPRLDPGEAEQVLAALMAYHARLWVLPAAVDSVDPAHFAAGWLDAHAHAVWRGDGFTLYMPPLADDAPGRSPELTFGDALRLERVAHELEPLHAGDPLRVTLFWRPLRSLESGVELTLELVDPSGYVWRREVTRPASLAQEEPGTPVVDYAGLMVPPGAPPGTYTLRLSLVDLGSGAALLPGEGASGDLFTLTVAADAPAEGGYRLPNAGAATFCAPDGTACVELAGVESGGVRFQQGYPVLMALHWRADAPLPDLQIRLEMLHRAWLPGLEGTPIVSWTLPLAPTFPSSGWPAGRLVTVPTAQALPMDAPTGRATVRVTVMGPDGAVWRAADGAPAVALFDIVVDARPALRRLPWRFHRIQVDFGEEVGLRGYRVEGEAQPGGELRLTYAWYAHTQPTAIYAVFNHLLTVDGTPVAQADGWPQEGRMLSIQWQPGDYIEDHYTLSIPPDAPPGPYQLYTGLYDALTGDRLPACEDGVRLLNDQASIPLPGGGR